MTRRNSMPLGQTLPAACGSGVLGYEYGMASHGCLFTVISRVASAHTPRVSKHRVFVWLPPTVLANDGTIVFARDDDYFFGVLHSRLHEVWARAQGTQLREEESGARYTPTTSFETFPLPWPPRKEPEVDPSYTAIANASRELVEKRDAWLAGVDPSDKKPRSLTRLYNERPTWLDLVHRRLDAAVAAAYGWSADMTDDQILERLLALNHVRTTTAALIPEPVTHPAASL